MILEKHYFNGNDELWDKRILQLEVIFQTLGARKQFFQEDLADLALRRLVLRKRARIEMLPEESPTLSPRLPVRHEAKVILLS